MKQMNYKILLTILTVTILLSCLGCSNTIAAWKRYLNEEMSLFGHRNWIVVVDSAYPKQSRPGIETVATNASHLEVLKAVMKAIEEAPHINANIYQDAELDSVSDTSAPGIEEYRNQLKQLLKDRNINKRLHEDIIYKLDKAAETFNVLILKTDFALPYTSIFFELDCGYWNAEKEKALRQSM
ncbi:MAG: hypothetical protein DRP65_09220 [Planctomycetota bacterium]|nr:MAG: hypothetical protein DRP65_09220 [Planctomycetota bacterium]